jgi:predicted Zn-dependent protease
VPPWGTQRNWRRCSKCQGLWFGPNAAQSTCPEGGPHSSAGSGNYRLPIVTSRVRVHTKVLSSPSVLLTTVFHNMREVYAAVNIDVEWATEEALNLPALGVVDVGQCVRGRTTSEQNQLFNNRNFAGATDVVVYFVLATDPPTNGCAAHPAGKPGAVVARLATQWTLAHEIGHVLGLFHVNNNDRLMTGNGTSNITNPPPDLVSPEASTMQVSPLTINV